MEYSVNTDPLLRDDNSINESPETRLTGSEPVVFTNDPKPILLSREPNDRLHFAYLIFYLMGIITLVPWNFFITADDYWMYKFRSTDNETRFLAKRSKLQAEFTSYLSVVTNVPTVLFLVINASLMHRVCLQIRVVGSLLLMLVFFILTTVLIKVNTDQWQELFFGITLTSAVFLSAASAVLSGSIFGVVGKFNSKYVTAVVSGQALGGILTSLTEIICLAIGESSVHSAFVYFMTGNFIIVLSTFCFVVLSKSLFFRYHVYHRNVRDNITEIARPPVASIRRILRRTWCHGISVALVFIVTLSVFPGVLVLIESKYKGTGHRWNDVYFVPVVCYLLFNVCDYMGRIMAGLVRWPEPDQRWMLLFLNVLRLSFIPMFIFCNAQPRHHIPVMIHGDEMYVMIMVLFAFSNGYLTNSSMMMAIHVVDHHEKELASSIMAAFLGTGLAIGSSISLGIVKLL